MLEIKNLRVTYTGIRPHVKAIQDLNLTLGTNESLGIIGESGCGKTTLAMAIMGLCRNTDLSGEIRFKGRDITRISERRLQSLRWKEIAMVFQNSLEVFNPVLTVGEQVKEPLTHLKLSSKATDIRVAALFTRVGLDPILQNSFAHELSGGMRQKALMAMALSCNPKLLIVDEPFTALDAGSRHQMVHLLQELQKEMGFAMILISHSLPAIQQLTSRTLTLYAGCALEQGRTREVLRNPLHPYTRGLINASPEFFPYKDLWGIKGDPENPDKGCPFRPRCVQPIEACSKSLPPLSWVGVERLVACHRGGITTLLSARGIQKSYGSSKNRPPALGGVDLIVRSGEVVALVGSSGSGKSTLAHILARVLKEDAGEVWFLGKKVTGQEATARTGGMQIVFQDPSESVSPRLKVLDAVREPLDIMKWEDRAKRDQKAIAALKAAHLPVTLDFLHRTCHALSGGQRQRLSVARAMVTDPLLLIADEITAMLDPSTQASLLRELKGLQHDRGFSMLFITHDMHLARKAADRVYVLEKGGIAEQGAAFEIFDHPRNRHTHQLLGAAFDHDRTLAK